MQTTRGFSLLVLGALTLMSVLSCVSPSHAADMSAPVVATDEGALQGVTADGVENFLGIPHAAPPVGALRWTPPQPAQRWSGVLDATNYRSFCPQPQGLDDPDGPTLDEDCLFINVQRPIGTTAAQKLPVFVYIHGGNNETGSGNKESQYMIVGASPVIGVTFNYRLGLLGFLALPSLAASNGEDVGNYGFEDQQAALRWVKRNIARFGGDPENVTLGGESSGGINVCSHLVSPGSRGLFSKAILQSVSCISEARTVAENLGTSIAASLGCTDASSSASCMRGQSVADLLKAAPLTVLLTRNTPTIPVNPRNQIAPGNFAQVPMLIGSNRDEVRSFASPFISNDAAQYDSLIQSTYGANAAAVLRRYPFPSTSDDPSAVAYQVAAAETDAGILFGTQVEDGIGGCAAALLKDEFANSVPVYSYEFSDENGPGFFPIAGYVWGAGHAAELPYLFLHDHGFTASRFRPGDTALSDQMVRYWGAFIQHADPNVAGQAVWPEYSATRSLLQLKPSSRSAAITLDEFRRQHQCGFWDRLRGASVEGPVQIPDDQRGE